MFGVLERRVTAEGLQHRGAVHRLGALPARCPGVPFAAGRAAVGHRALAAVPARPDVPRGAQGYARGPGHLPERGRGVLGEEGVGLHATLRAVQRTYAAVPARPGPGVRTVVREVAPQRRDRLGGQADLGGDGAVGPFAVEQEERARRLLAVRERQRQPVPGVGLHGADEGRPLRAVEVDDADGAPAVEQGGVEPVHPVDDGHRPAVHQDGRQRLLDPGQEPDVVGVDARAAGDRPAAREATGTVAVTRSSFPAGTGAACGWGKGWSSSSIDARAATLFPSGGIGRCRAGEKGADRAPRCTRATAGPCGTGGPGLRLLLPARPFPGKHLDRRDDRV